MIQIIKMTQTCSMCPSQWDGWDENGTYYYFRYRWGCLTVHKDEIFGEEIVSEQIGGSFDGFLSYSELRERVREVMCLPPEENSEP